MKEAAMRGNHKTVFGILAILSLLALLGRALLQPIGTVSVQALTPVKMGKQESPSATTDTGLEITAYVTGWVEAPADILIDQEATNLPNELTIDQWVPSVAYAVRHPDLGVVILDAGLRAGDCDYGTRPVYWVPCRNTLGSDLVSQLKRTNIRPQDIRHIIPSHFHGDHISGLESLLAYTDAPLLMTSGSLDEIQSPTRFAAGIPSAMLASDMRVELLDTHWKVDPLLGESFDVFGDGSLKIFQTQGHTNDHLSALVVTKNQTTLLMFDAAHLRANFDLGIPSGAVTSQQDALESLERIHNISDAMPGIMIIYGHEPTQWACIDASINLDLLNPTCDPSVSPPNSLVKPKGRRWGAP
jgi:N-acyl homoserine lactone hydrolase